jgi:hypothetical protein
MRAGRPGIGLEIDGLFAATGISEIGDPRAGVALFAWIRHSRLADGSSTS